MPAYAVPHGGSGGGLPAFEFTQGTPSDTWTITHGLGTYPGVVVVDSAGSFIIPDIEYPDTVSVIIRFAGATSGKASLHA